MVKHFGIDRILLVSALMLMAIGLLMIYSTSIIVAKENYGDGLFFLKKQLVWMGLGLVIFFFILFLEKPLYLNQKVVIAMLIASVIGLLAVFFSESVNNTFRWVRFAGVSFQPSEMAKIAVVMYLAYMLTRNHIDINQPLHLLLVLFPVMIVAGLILKEPDFGNFMLILIITVLMLFIAGLRFRYFFAGAAMLIPMLYFIIRIDPLRMQRILSFLNPEMYASTSGFQSLQSLWAIGSGGLFGQGIGNSSQKLFFLPYAYSDFIFAIIAEEFGFIGALLVIGLFVVFLARGLQVARHADNPQIYMLVSGLTFLLVVQALMNVSVTICIFPTKGIPLPFISSGGTSLVSSLLITALILNVSSHRKMVFAND